MKLFPSIFLSLLLPLAVAAQNVKTQNGAIRAEFSVSDSTKVYFSQGNLQYQASTNTWRFAEHQWDCVGDSIKGNVYENGVKSDNSKISPTYEGWIDLFGWRTSGYKGKNPYETSMKDSDYADGDNDIAGTNYDWGVYNKISNGGNQVGIWRMLTNSEWRYLIFYRTDANALCGTASVNGVNGCVLLPDNWLTPTGVTFQVEERNKPVDGYVVNTYSASEWAVMESYGAVFLPAAGNRLSVEVRYVDDLGDYWSSTANTADCWRSDNYYSADCVDLYRYGVGTGNWNLRYGHSVRLVQNVRK